MNTIRYDLVESELQVLPASNVIVYPYLQGYYPIRFVWGSPTVDTYLDVVGMSIFRYIVQHDLTDMRIAR